MKALYRGWSIPCAGTQVYATRYREEWLGKIEHTGVRRRAELLYQQLDGLQALAANAAARVIGGEPETPSNETAAPDSLHRSESSRALDRVDANPAPVPQQATTVDLQWLGH